MKRHALVVNTWLREARVLPRCKWGQLLNASTDSGTRSGGGGTRPVTNVSAIGGWTPERH
jgi:hypothetical protein